MCWKIHRGAGEMTQEVKCLMYNSEDPCLIPGTHMRKLDYWDSLIRHPSEILAKEWHCLRKKVLCMALSFGEGRCSLDSCWMTFSVFPHSVLLANCKWIQWPIAYHCNHVTSEKTAGHTAEIDPLHMVARLGDAEPGLRQSSVSQEAAHLQLRPGRGHWDPCGDLADGWVTVVRSLQFFTWCFHSCVPQRSDRPLLDSTQAISCFSDWGQILEKKQFWGEYASYYFFFFVNSVKATVIWGGGRSLIEKMPIPNRLWPSLQGYFLD